jgi:hypothetical protein
MYSRRQVKFLPILGAETLFSSTILILASSPFNHPNYTATFAAGEPLIKDLPGPAVLKALAP